jgi:hypothetical protein
MAKTLQLRRYTTSNLASITGASGELIVDTTLNAITVHTGSKAGGFYAANAITLQSAFTQANAAYAQANTQANSTQANLAFTQANSAYGSQNTTGTYANAAFTQANSVYLASATRLDVTNGGSSAYLFDQYTGNNATLYVTAGETIAFNLNVTGHPFLIRVSSSNTLYNIGLTHVTTTGVVTTNANAQGQVSGTLYWKVPSVLADNTYVYQCQVHAGMVGNIVIGSPNQSNLAFAQANSSYGSQNTTGTYANAAFLTANTPSNVANSAALYANGAFAAANTAANTIPQNPQTTNYVLQLSDAGKHIYYTQAANTTLYIPTTSNVAFSNGTTIMIVSKTTSGANVTVSPNTGVTMYLAGNTTSISRNVTTYGMATLIQVAANTWFINGTGVA